VTKEDLTRQRMEAVWHERADRLSQRAVLAEGGADTLQVIVLKVGNERYGVDLADVAEVLPPLHATPVPGAPAVFSGVINIHGEILPVMDLRRFLSLDAIEDGSIARVILLCKDGRKMGLQIESVEQIRRIERRELINTGNGNTGWSWRIKASTMDLLMLLSTEALFAELHTGDTT
jgi:chemotaxis signal transduction protein